MTLRFALVHEATGDFQTATELADRVLLEAIGWMDADQLAVQREWLEVIDGDRRLSWKGVRRLAEDAGIEAKGHFDGQPGLADAKAARRALRYLRARIPQLGGVVLIRDQDHQPERRQGLEQARGEFHGQLVIVLGLAIVEREAWVISGFDPQDEAETARLDGERRTLGFDPRVRSHDLTACKNDQAPHSPKRVLRQLSGDDRDRERRCWTETCLELLRERGNENGLAAFLQEVRERLATLIGYVPPPE